MTILPYILMFYLFCASFYAALSWVRRVGAEEKDELFPYDYSMHDTDDLRVFRDGVEYIRSTEYTCDVPATTLPDAVILNYDTLDTATITDMTIEGGTIKGSDMTINLDHRQYNLDNPSKERLAAIEEHNKEMAIVWNKCFEDGLDKLLYPESEPFGKDISE